MTHSQVVRCLCFVSLFIDVSARSSAATIYTFTTFDVPGAFNTNVNGINERGQIVGGYRDSSPGFFHGFLDTAGTFTTIDVPGAAGTQVRGINDSGQIVGQYNDSTGAHGFLDSDGSFTMINLFIFETLAQGINDSGQIVGYVYRAESPDSGFLYTAGRFTLFNVPGFQFGSDTYAFGINDSGQIVGTYYYTSVTGPSHGFVATPTVVPEPRTLPLLAGCLIGLAAALRRKSAPVLRK